MATLCANSSLGKGVVHLCPPQHLPHAKMTWLEKEMNAKTPSLVIGLLLGLSLFFYLSHSCWEERSELRYYLSTTGGEYKIAS